MKEKQRPVDIAKKLGISTSSLRNYEAKGLVPPTERLTTGYRVYREEHIAYFECIAAMSPGFGMTITSAVMQMIQHKDLDAALWIINKAQVTNYEDKVTTEQAMNLIEKLEVEQTLGQTMTEEHMTIGEVSNKTQVSTSTLRYWVKEGLISSTIDNDNNYRLFDLHQVIKVLLMKATQNAVYSHDTVKFKQTLKEINIHDLQKAKKLVYQAQLNLNKRNQEQLKGLYFLHRLYS